MYGVELQNIVKKLSSTVWGENEMWTSRYKTVREELVASASAMSLTPPANWFFFIDFITWTSYENRKVTLKNSFLRHLFCFRASAIDLPISELSALSCVPWFRIIWYFGKRLLTIKLKTIMLVFFPRALSNTAAELAQILSC